MGDLVNFIMIFFPAGIVLAHSLVEIKHRHREMQEMQKHNDFMLQMVTREMLAHLRTQDEIITGLRRQLDA